MGENIGYYNDFSGGNRQRQQIDGPLSCFIKSDKTFEGTRGKMFKINSGSRTPL
jgi:hypothetical protein